MRHMNCTEIICKRFSRHWGTTTAFKDARCTYCIEAFGHSDFPSSFDLVSADKLTKAKTSASVIPSTESADESGTWKVSHTVLRFVPSRCVCRLLQNWRMQRKIHFCGCVRRTWQLTNRPLTANVVLSGMTHTSIEFWFEIHRQDVKGRKNPNNRRAPSHRRQIITLFLTVSCDPMGAREVSFCKFRESNWTIKRSPRRSGCDEKTINIIHEIFKNNNHQVAWCESHRM